jgi:aminoglycoside 6-adenylyltransferase
MRRFQTRSVAWARAEPSVRAMFLVGSRARAHPPADEWADLDFEVFAVDYDRLLSDTSWLQQLGTLWAKVVINQTGDGGEQAVLALFEDAYKVDFHFRPVDLLLELAQSSSLPEPFARGYRLLLDKDGRAAGMQPAPDTLPPAESPSREAFSATTDNFWYGAVYVAKQILRRNLWVVKYRDWTMKESLLPMMEWHAGATKGWDLDTFNDGHFLKQWADADTWEALHAAFGRFDAAEAWAALFATMALFRRLARETGSALGYRYKEALDENVTRWIERAAAADGHPPDDAS